MTLTPSRPVPEAISEEQQRLEVELLVGEPVLQDIELQAAGQDLLLAGKGLSTERWRELGALPLLEANGRLSVAVPSHWVQKQRQELSDALEKAGYGADLKLALASNLTEMLAVRSVASSSEASNPSQQPRPTTAFNAPRSLTKDLGIAGIGSGGELQEVADVEDLEINAAAASRMYWPLRASCSALREASSASNWMARSEDWAPWELVPPASPGASPGGSAAAPGGC